MQEIVTGVWWGHINAKPLWRTVYARIKNDPEYLPGMR